MQTPKLHNLILISFAISATLFLLTYLLFSLPPTNLIPTTVPQKSFVFFHNLNHTNIKANLILKEQALLFDAEPIYLPSQWNESHSIDYINPPLFQDFPPDLALSTYSPFSLSSKNTPIPSPLDTLNIQCTNPFSGINQNTPTFHPLPKRLAYVTIENLNTSETIDAYEIPPDDNLHIEYSLWAPLQFLFLVDESGPILPPLLSESSGAELVDNFFKNYISSLPLKISRLNPGYYNITISP